MPEQLSLFAEENVTFNAGMQQLLELDFSGCLETFERYRKSFPWARDVSFEIEIATFLHARLANANWRTINLQEAEEYRRIWEESQTTFGYPWNPDSIGDKLEARYFSMLVDGLHSGTCSETIRFPDGTPVGLFYMLARRPREATRALEASIRDKPDDAATYGYLGDAYFLLGDTRRARVCYREAFTIEPLEVDLERIKDDELKESLDLLGDDDEVGGNHIA